MYVCVYIYIYIYLSISLSLSIYIYIYTYIILFQPSQLPQEQPDPEDVPVQTAIVMYFSFYDDLSSYCQYLVFMYYLFAICHYLNAVAARAARPGGRAGANS